MNKLAKRIWKRTWWSGAAGLVFTDEGGNIDHSNADGKEGV